MGHVTNVILSMFHWWNSIVTVYANLLFLSNNSVVCSILSASKNVILHVFEKKAKQKQLYLPKGQLSNVNNEYGIFIKYVKKIVTFHHFSVKRQTLKFNNGIGMWGVGAWMIALCCAIHELPLFIRLSFVTPIFLYRGWWLSQIISI